MPVTVCDISISRDLGLTEYSTSLISPMWRFLAGGCFVLTTQKSRVMAVIRKVGVTFYFSANFEP